MPLDSSTAWGTTRVLRYLDEHAITVRVESGVPRLCGHPMVPESLFRSWAAAVLPHLVVRRAEVLAELGRCDPAGAEVPDPRVGSAAFRRLSGADRRRVILRRLFGVLKLHPEYRMGWSSVYTRRTGWLVPPEVSSLPDHATYLSLYVADSSAAGGWRAGEGYALPLSRTPPGFSPPVDFLFPAEWVPGPDFRPRKPSVRALRKKWAERWRTHATFRDTLPPD